MFKKMKVYSETIDNNMKTLNSEEFFSDVLKDKQGINDKEQEQRQRKELENTVKAAIKEQLNKGKRKIKVVKHTILIHRIEEVK